MVFSVEVPAVDFWEVMLFIADPALLSELNLVVSGIELFKLES